MRVLEFDVNRQKITKTKGCDFKHLVAGSVGYLKAKFNFSNNGNAWAGCAKAASFWKDDKEYAVLLDANNCCNIPDEVADGRVFYVSVTGAIRCSNMIKGEVSEYVINTNKIKVVQGVG